MASTEVSVETLTRPDTAEAAAVLARAFRDNPAMVAVMAHDAPEARLRLVEACMLGFVQAARRCGVVEIVRDEGAIVAVSLAVPPGHYPFPFFGQVISAKGPLLTGLARALRFARLDRETRRRHFRDRHWYLWFLGVDPERQGQGLGSRLLRSLSTKAAADGAACYLETDKASSVRLYERHGYSVSSEETLPSLDLKMWFMTRK